MDPFQSVTIADRAIDLYKFSGEVVDEKMWTTTQVSGGGGGYNVGSGKQNPISISSTSVAHNQFFLKSDSGEEKAIELPESSVAFRKGHRVTVFWGQTSGTNQSQYVGVVNHTLNTSATFPSAVDGFCATGTPCLIQIAWIASIFLICFYGTGFIGIIILYLHSRTQKELKKQRVAILQSAIDAAIAQAKSAQTP